MQKIFDRYLEKLSDNMSILPDKSEETPYNTLKALWLAAAGESVSVVNAEKADLPALSDDALSELEEMVNRRLNNVPLAHITGRQSFMGMEMLAGPDALIPRKETEILGNAAIQILKEISCAVEEPHVIDVCTGAGNIALAIANSDGSAKVFAADLSEDAVRLAKQNAEFTGLSSQVEFHCGDLLEPLECLELSEKIHLLTCNPPYISTSRVSDMPDEISEHEPSLAFDGGAFGVNLIRRLISDAEKFLCKGGYLAFEVGLGQGDLIRKQVERSAAYTNIKTVSDDSGNPRVVIAQKI